MDKDRIAIRGDLDTPAAFKSVQTISTSVKIRRGYKFEFYLRKLLYIADYTVNFHFRVRVRTFGAVTNGGKVYSAVISSSLA